MSTPAYARVALALPMDRLFHYAIPDRLAARIAVGKRVFVQFVKRRVVGYVVAIDEKADVPDVKDVLDVIDDEPILSGEMLRLTSWIRDNYLCSWGEAIEAAIPGGNGQVVDVAPSAVVTGEDRADHSIARTRDQAHPGIVLEVGLNGLPGVCLASPHFSRDFGRSRRK